MDLLDDILEGIGPILPGLVVAGVFIGSLVVLRLLFRQDKIVTKLRFPSALLSFYLFLSVMMLLAHLYWPAGYGALRVGSLFVLVLAVILSIFFAVFDIFLGRYRKVQMPKILRDILLIIVYVIAVIVVLGRHGFDLTSILTTSAVLTAIVGFALQDTLSNIISGLALQIERPFATNDWVKFDDQEGWVLEINWRSTKLQTLHRDIVVIPNNVITRSSLINFTSPSRIHRRKLNIGLRYEAPPNVAKDSILNAMKSVVGVIDDPAPFVLLRRYDDFSIAYRIHFFIDDFPNKERIEDQVYTRIWYQLKRDGLSIPFPIRDVNLRQITADDIERDQQAALDGVVATLSQVPWMEPLSTKERRDLARLIKRQCFARGEEVIRQGDDGDSFYIITAGEVEVCVGRARKVVATLKADNYFGEMSLMTGEERSATIVARMDCDCFVIDREAFKTIIQANEALIEAFVDRLASRRGELEVNRTRDPTVKVVPADEEARSLVLRIRKFFNLK